MSANIKPSKDRLGQVTTGSPDYIRLVQVTSFYFRMGKVR
jgi:hypothetical protein